MSTDLNKKNTTYGINSATKVTGKVQFCTPPLQSTQRVGLLRSHYVTTVTLALRLGGAQFYTTPGGKRGQYLYYLLLYVHNTKCVRYSPSPEYKLYVLAVFSLHRVRSALDQGPGRVAVVVAVLAQRQARRSAPPTTFVTVQYELQLRHFMPAQHY